MSRHRDSRGAYVRLDSPKVEPAAFAANATDQQIRDAWVSEVMQALPFELDLRYAFRRPDHIDVLEVYARLSLVEMLARSSVCHSLRHLVRLCPDVLQGGFPEIDGY